MIFIFFNVSMKPNKTLKISIKKQRLYFLDKEEIVKSYSISTSKYGVGNEYGSNKTPLGLHCISNKIGRNASLGDIFIKRQNTHKKARRNFTDNDFITTRILRLQGLERGVNKGRGIDTFKRCIYVHGTSHENLIGKPASHGCIRMRNRDIIDLFNSVKRGFLVEIRK